MRRATPCHKAEWWKMLRTTVRIFNAAAASWEKNPKLGFGWAATQIPTPIIRQYDGDGDYFDDDDDDYIHIMMECALVCLWVMKNDNCLKRGGSVRLWVIKMITFSRRSVGPPRSVKKWPCFSRIVISRRWVGSPCESQKVSTFTIWHLKDQLVPPGSDKKWTLSQE